MGRPTKNLEPRVCEACGVTYTPKEKKQKNCSRPCGIKQAVAKTKMWGTR